MVSNPGAITKRALLEESTGGSAKLRRLRNPLSKGSRGPQEREYANTDCGLCEWTHLEFCGTQL